MQASNKRKKHNEHSRHSKIQKVSFSQEFPQNLQNGNNEASYNVKLVNLPLSVTILQIISHFSLDAMTTVWLKCIVEDGEVSCILQIEDKDLYDKVLLKNNTILKNRKIKVLPEDNPDLQLENIESEEDVESEDEDINSVNSASYTITPVPEKEPQIIPVEPAEIYSKPINNSPVTENRNILIKQEIIEEQEQQVQQRISIIEAAKEHATNTIQEMSMNEDIFSDNQTRQLRSPKGYRDSIYFVSVENLPSIIKVNQIVKHFSLDCNNRIKFIKSGISGGKVCKLRFQDKELFKKALEKHHTYIGENRIDVFPDNRNFKDGNNFNMKENNSKTNTRRTEESSSEYSSEEESADESRKTENSVLYTPERKYNLRHSEPSRERELSNNVLHNQETMTPSCTTERTHSQSKQKGMKASGSRERTYSQTMDNMNTSSNGDQHHNKMQENLNTSDNKDKNQSQSMQIMEIIQTAKGRKLLLDNFAYVIDKQQKNIIYWRCERKDGCKGRLKTQGDVILTEPTDHHHPPDPARILSLKTENSNCTQDHITSASVDQQSHSVKEILDTSDIRERKDSASMQESPHKRKPDDLLKKQDNNDESFNKDAIIDLNEDSSSSSGDLRTPSVHDQSITSDIRGCTYNPPVQEACPNKDEIYYLFLYNCPTKDTLKVLGHLGLKKGDAKLHFCTSKNGVKLCNLEIYDKKKYQRCLKRDNQLFCKKRMRVLEDKYKFSQNNIGTVAPGHNKDNNYETYGKRMQDNTIHEHRVNKIIKFDEELNEQEPTTSKIEVVRDGLNKIRRFSDSSKSPSTSGTTKPNDTYNVFVKNLQFNTTENMMKKILDFKNERPVIVFVPGDNQKLNCFVKFVHLDNFKKALSKNCTVVNKSVIEVHPDKNSIEKKNNYTSKGLGVKRGHLKRRNVINRNEYLNNKAFHEYQQTEMGQQEYTERNLMYSNFPGKW